MAKDRWQEATLLHSTQERSALRSGRFKGTVGKEARSLDPNREIVVIPNVSDSLCLRDRAILETLYSTGYAAWNWSKNKQPEAKGNCASGCFLDSTNRNPSGYWIGGYLSGILGERFQNGPEPPKSVFAEILAF